MRTIQFLAVAALLAVVVVASPGCKKETPAPSAASVEQKAAQPEAQPAPGSAPAGQGAPADPGTQPAPDKAGSQPAAAGTSGAEAMAPASGGEARPEAVPDNSAAAPSPEAIAPGDTDPATCGDRIAAQEARLRREVLPRLRADQEAAENVAGWVDGTVKELRAEMDTSDRKRQEEHGKEYAACVRELTGARAERDPVCVAYVTSDDTACDRVADLGLRSECRRLVAQKKNGGELRGFGPPASQPVFLDKALLPDMRYEFDPDDPQCTLARAKVVQSPPMGVKGVLFMPMGKPDQSFTQPFMGNGPPTGQGAPPTGQGAPPGGQPGMAPGGALGGQPGMAPGGGPGGQPGGPGQRRKGAFAVRTTRPFPGRPWTTARRAPSVFAGESLWTMPPAGR